MKKLFCILFILCTSVAFAQDQALLKAFQSIKTLEADFVQENYYPGLDSYKYKGKVYIERGNKALWDYTNPEEFYLLESGSVTHYSAELKQAVKMHVDMSTFDDPSAVLLGLMLSVTSVTDNFNVTESGDIFTLVPKKDYGIENIIIEMKDGKIQSIKSSDGSGGRISIIFSNIKQNQSLNSEVFTKTLPAGTDFIEQ